MKTEILLSFLLGSMPMILSRNQPDFSAVKALASLNPGDLIFKYFLYLLGVHFLIWFISCQILKTNQVLSNIIQQLHEFTHKLGFAIHGIYRALTGAVPVAMIYELEKHGLVQGWQRITILSIVLVCASLLASLALSKATEYTAPRQSLFSK
ncbi:hypothetical protein [Marinomonas polaris]|uniref:hypothetical protein n=1 Tax=Marinomonas polaris TaxID=293552 RepID=UPI003F9650B9